MESSPKRPYSAAARPIPVFAGLALLVAATLRSWQYIRSPIPPPGQTGLVGFDPAMIGSELFLGLWLISGASPNAARRLAIGCFSVFACYTLYEALAGKTDCGCFGQVHVNPWYTFILDVSLVLMLTFVGGRGTGIAGPSWWARKKRSLQRTAAQWNFALLVNIFALTNVAAGNWGDIMSAMKRVLLARKTFSVP